jgi:molybdenum cofactor guanylyltransferase
MHAPRASIAVLAGGRASRLGGAKATAPLGGKPLICHVLDAARSSGLPAVVLAKRRTPLPQIGERVMIEPDEPRHPICGVLAALDQLAGCSQAALLLTACDMPFLTGPLLRWLAGLDGAAMARVGGQLQPLPARVTSAHRPQLARALASERSMRSALEELHPRVVEERELARFGEPARLCFSVNDPADLRLAREWMAGREPGGGDPAGRDPAGREPGRRAGV